MVNKKYIVVVLVFIILTGLLYIALRLNLDDAIQEIIPETNDRQKTGEKEIIISKPQQELEEQEFYERQQTEGQQSSEGNEEDQADGETEHDYCTQIIAYSMLEFNKEETCNTYEEEICIDKTVNCIVSVQNLDQSVGGDFTIRFEFKDRATGTVIETLIQTKYIEPETIALFSKENNFRNSEAGYDINCGFSTESAPTQIIC